ncbi:MAG: hypothetical protein JNK76_26965 [Planctomycetales bacterium]|nr:hypothetical protein [Planctomycetales bacterium]
MKKFLMLTLVAASFSLLGADYASAASTPGCNCPPAAAASVSPAVPAATMAQAPTTQSRRSFSVEPGAAPAATYSRARVYRPARTPSYLLPKSDPRRYNGF